MSISPSNAQRKKDEKRKRDAALAKELKKKKKQLKQQKQKQKLEKQAEKARQKKIRDAKKKLEAKNRVKAEKKKAKRLERLAALDERLLRVLAELGITVTELLGDGNCFYRGLLNASGEDEERHNELRQIVVEYIQEHIDQYRSFWNEKDEGMTLEEHLEQQIRKLAVLSFYYAYYFYYALCVQQPTTNQHIFRLSIAGPGVVASDLIANATADVLNLHLCIYDANYLDEPGQFPLDIVPENPRDDLTKVTLIRRFDNHFDGAKLPEDESASKSSSSSDSSCSPQSSHSSAKDSSDNEDDDLFDDTAWEESRKKGM